MLVVWRKDTGRRNHGSMRTRVRMFFNLPYPLAPTYCMCNKGISIKLLGYFPHNGRTSFKPCSIHHTPRPCSRSDYCAYLFKAWNDFLRPVDLPVDSSLVHEQLVCAYCHHSAAPNSALPTAFTNADVRCQRRVIIITKSCSIVRRWFMTLWTQDE